MSNNGFPNIKPAKLGTLFALLTILYSFALGATFGLFETEVKDHLAAEAAAVKDTIYEGDQAKMDKITDKSWVYCKRAHMHASGLGAIALAIIVYMGVIGTPCFIKFLGSLSIGLGSLGYSVFWTLAALTAPGLGSTGEAKEALYWLAQPSAGLCILGLLLAFLAFLLSMCCGCQSEDAC